MKKIIVFLTLFVCLHNFAQIQTANWYFGIGFPKFFTTNDDSYHDTWHVYGINDASQFSSDIYIFDRYEKLLKQLSPQDQGWDGTFNGENLPTNDYWFHVKLQDGRVFKSHFTLKR